MKNTVPATVEALDTTFSPAASVIFQPFRPSGSVPETNTVLVASNTSPSPSGLPVGVVEKPEILTEVLLVAPFWVPAAPESRSLNM